MVFGTRPSWQIAYLDSSNWFLSCMSPPFGDALGFKRASPEQGLRSGLGVPAGFGAAPHSRGS